MSIGIGTDITLGTRRGASVSGGGGWPASLRSSLMAFWKLDESSGNRADSVGSNTLTDYSLSAAAAGLVYANAANYVNDAYRFLWCVDNAALSMGNINFWCAAWVRPTTVASSMVVLAKAPSVTGTLWAYVLRVEAADTNWYVGNGVATAFVSGGVLSANAWSLLVCYHDATNDLIGISINGGAFVTAAHATGSYDDTGPFNIGDRGQHPDALLGRQTFNGRIGPVMVAKNYVPTADDVTWLYNGGAGRAL